MSATLHNSCRAQEGQWIRGNFHCHCSENSGCSTVPLAEGVRRYHEIGARFLAVTDHDCVTDLSKIRARYPGMIFLEGFEYSKCENVLFIGEKVPPLHNRTLDGALTGAAGLLTVICHPQPRPNEEYWPFDKILALPRLPDGIEIYNGHYGVESMIARGITPLYTALWDRLLTAGRRLWGFANDDFHDPADFDNAFNMVLVREQSAAAVLDAAKNGRFYASTGLLLDRVGEDGGRISVAVAEDCTGRFIGPGGTVLAEAAGRTFEYEATDEAYVRFEAEAESGKLFLQPMFRTRG